MIKKKKNKALVVDVSGIDPIAFSLTNKYLNDSRNLKEFFKSRNIDLYFPSSCVGEFLFQHCSQESLFVGRLSLQEESIKQAGGSIYLSDTGSFSGSSFNNDCCEIKSFQGIHNSSPQLGLWQVSTEYQNLSSNDKNIISTAMMLEKNYEYVAILSNDSDLRSYCQSYEGISVYGTCSLLAGMVLAEIFSYQKGTAIYNKWLDEDPRWIPSDLRFKEVLNLERQRLKDGKCFWLSRKEQLSLFN